jgi:hypothetical protein
MGLPGVEFAAKLAMGTRRARPSAKKRVVVFVPIDATHCHYARCDIIVNQSCAVE